MELVLMDEFNDKDVIQHINDCEKRIQEKLNELVEQININE